VAVVVASTQAGATFCGNSCSDDNRARRLRRSARTGLAARTQRLKSIVSRTLVSALDDWITSHRSLMSEIELMSQHTATTQLGIELFKRLILSRDHFDRIATNSPSPSKSALTGRRRDRRRSVRSLSRRSIGRIVRSNATTESRLLTRGKGKSEIASFRSPKSQKPAISNAVLPWIKRLPLKGLRDVSRWTN
jgi:hypothetical protein